MTTILSDCVGGTTLLDGAAPRHAAGRFGLPAWRDAGTGSGFVETAVSLVVIVVLTAFGGLSLADALGGIAETRPAVVTASAPPVTFACESPHPAL